MAWGFGKDKNTKTEGEDLRRQAQSADRQSQFVDAFDLWLRLAEAKDPEAAFTVGDRYERGSGVLQSFTEAALWFQRAADLGWEAAYGKLGDLYFSGRTAALTASIKDPPSPAQGRLSAFASLASKSAALPADYVEAAKWNLKAADLGDPKAQVRLAYQYASKLGVPEDFAAAEWWFSEAASRGEPSGQLGVGMILAGGHGRRKDTATAATWFEKAAAQGNANAKVCLAVLLTQDDVVERNPQKAVTLLAQAAESRPPQAMFLLGEYLRFGVGCRKDDAEAESWLRRAALTGHVGAMVSAGTLLRNRKDPDFSSAAAFFREAADLDHPHAQFALAELYVRGLGVPQDGAQAAFWFEKAASQGVISAYQRLGAMYADGLGLDQNFGAAAEWFGKAAEAGQKTTYYEMGTLHHYGLGVARDPEKALEYYRLASQNSDARASLRLGILYAQGELVAQSWEEAAKYYGIAAAQGNADAELNLAFLMIRELAIGDRDLGLEILAESAENGDQKAVWALYQLYSDGRYLPADPKIAEAWLLKAVEAGSPVAIVELGRKLKTDEPTPLTPDKIIALLGVTAHSGDVPSQSMLGYFLYEGLHVPADPASALVWFTRAANRGDILAQAWLGDVLATGKGVPKDRDASKMWYERAAAQGHVGSLLALTAMASPPGQNPEEDAALFEQWLKAAEGGDALAQRMVGDFRIRGVRCKQSVGEGAMWLRMASEQGNAAAKLILSGLIISGSVAPDHPNEAANLMQQAAVQGSVEASYNLGVCYRLGVGGVSTDAGTAMEWYRRAANQDYAPAQLELGDLLLEVSASEEALSEARTWYSAASRAGLAKASLHLGRMHEVGVGAPKNQQLAMQFYQRAADAGLREGAAGVQRCSGGRI